MGSLAAQQTVDELSREELVSYACNAHAAAEERKKAIELLAKKDDWQSLGRILVWCTRNSNTEKRRVYEDRPKDFVQNVDNIQSLDIPEFFLIGELLRIANPGAIAYLRQYQADRYSLPVTNLMGESLASLEASIQSLEKSLLDWVPVATEERKKSGPTKKNDQ